MTSSILRYIHRLALTFVIGEMLFFAAIFAPRVFKVLERADAAKLQSSIFPAYFLVGIIGTALMIFVRGLELRHVYLQSKKLYWLPIFLLVVVFIIFEISYSYLTPAIAEQTRLAIESGSPRVESSLHAWSVRLNASALLILLVYLGLKEPTFSLASSHRLS